MKKKYFLLILFLLLSGCVTASKITPKLSLGMTKQQVLQNCGRPYKSGATIDPKTGETIEALTYREFIYDSAAGDLVTPPPTFINIYFKDGKVVQYGEGADWKTLSDYEGERKVKITTDEKIKIEKQ